MTTSTVTANDAARPDAGAKLALVSHPPGPSRQGGDTRTVPKGYVLPHDIAQRLGTALAGYKNREAAHALALFLARFWSSRARMVRPFPIDRRALADRDDLGLSEARIRGALRVLEEIGFLNRGLPPVGSVHRMTPDGLHRKAITFGFGPDYGPLFAAANARAERARARREGRAVNGPATANARQRAPVAKTHSPKDKDRSEAVVIMGEVAKKGSSGEPRVDRGGPPAALLEAALARLDAARRSHAGA